MYPQAQRQPRTDRHGHGVELGCVDAGSLQRLANNICKQRMCATSDSRQSCRDFVTAIPSELWLLRLQASAGPPAEITDVH